MNIDTTANGLALRLAGLIYSACCYLIFLLTFLYLIGFIGHVVVPKNIDDGIVINRWWAALINLSLLLLFALQHTVMARQGFKSWLARYIPTAVERSTYVLLSSLVLMLMFWLWHPMPAPVWAVEASLLRVIVSAIFWLGWVLVLVATLLISHFELFGLKQAIDRYRNAVPRVHAFKTPGLYKLVRHPLYLGFLIVFWATPDMSAGRLLFALGMSAYLFIGAHFEERDLVALFGEQYRGYQKRVGMVLPKFGPGIGGKKR
ncbi:MAG: methanethiol S-methyltransferase [Pseudomonas proteolytica]|uniref:methanethiol S-methyltransferase n=1 Tax=Pseudomonas proteolytica TaxID=219574 RepID=UPI003F2BFBEF